MTQKPSDTEILDWIEKERADVMPHTDKDGKEKFGVSRGTLMHDMIAWAPTLREAAAKAMRWGKK